MSNSYMNVVGPPPDPRSQSWRSWMRRLIQKWWAYCDKPRAVTYYFADDGDDTTGNGTITTPWQTIAKAQAVHDDPGDGSDPEITHGGSNYELSFANNDCFDSTTGSKALDITATNVTISDWLPDGETSGKVWFDRFRTVSSVGGSVWTVWAGATFTADAGTDVITASGWTPSNDVPLLLTNSGGALPAGLQTEVIYYSIESTGATCKLALTPGGSAIDITGAGTGTHTLSAAPSVNTYTFTANATSDVITVGIWAPVDGTPVWLTTSASDFPSGLAGNTTYYVIDSSGQTCKLSLTPGGAAVNIIDTGTIPHYLHKARCGNAFSMDYSGLVANVPDWVCIKEDRFCILQKAASEAACDATNYSWYYDASVGSELLYVNLAGVDPDTVTVQIIEPNDTDGIVMRGDGCIRKGDIWCTGFGFNYGRAGGSNRYGQRAATADGKLCVIDGGGSIYASTHACGHYPSVAGEDGTTGGLALISNVVAGICAPDSGGSVTVLNSYRTNGGFETIYDGCDVRWGKAPVVGDPSAAGGAISFHTTSESYRVGLFIVNKLSSSLALVKNCILAVRNMGSNALSRVGVYNDADVLVNNAYYGFRRTTNTSDYSNDATGITLGDLPLDHAPPGPGTTLATSGVYSGLEYDQNWSLRCKSTPTIGPWESVPQSQAHLPRMRHRW